VTAAPEWPEAARDPAAMRRPALLTSGSDEFMDELAAVLAAKRPDLAPLRARPESHRARPAGADRGWKPPAGALKLYQPIHGRFNLVTACLVCGRPGLPDHPPNPGAEEQAAFVLRRLDARGREEAWAADAAAPQDRGWRPLGEDGARLADGEELLPLFPVIYGPAGRRRRLLTGLIPTASLESFKAAGTLAPGHDPGQDPRVVEFDLRIVRAVKALREPPAAGAPGAARAEPSRFVLLDLADLLALNLAKTEWDAIVRGDRGGAGKAVALYEKLAEAKAPRALATKEPDTTWLDALRKAWAERGAITGESTVSPTLDVDLGLPKNAPDLDALKKAFVDALPALGAGATPPSVETESPADTSVPKLDPGGTGRYVVRCVYQRPRCGPLRPDLFSDPSRPFRIASFFDPDAPGRPIRISLPVDTSVKDLRKFRRNVAFVISEQLRGQMSKVTDLEKTMKGDLAGGQEFNLGVICSLSIPIITICALIVLMIFLMLLNLVFWWLPFFRICFPVGRSS
jgi:hypothetical protein